MLFGHPAAHSFPETFFFALATPQHRRLRRLGIASRSAGSAYRRLAELGLRPAPRARAPLRMARCADDFVACLDAAADLDGKRLWVEKTPIHLHYVEEIERHVAGARFIHIVRSGAGTISSLYDVTNRYPERWAGRRSVNQCITRWCEDLERSAACVGRDRHAFVSYERMVAEPLGVLDGLCRFLGLPAERPTLEAMLAARRDRLGKVSRDEPWKQGVAAELANADAAKLERRLPAPQRAAVLAAVGAEQPTLERFAFL